jgi:hypothetical protein
VFKRRHSEFDAMSRISPCRSPRIRSDGRSSPRGDIAALEGVAEFDFDKGKTQAMVVGSDIVSFVKGVSEAGRRDVVNCALLAQLAANKRAPRAANIFRWYDAYCEALTNVGWVVQTGQFVKHVEQSQNFSAHEVTVATSLLGPSAAALQAVKATARCIEIVETKQSLDHAIQSRKPVCQNRT